MKPALFQKFLLGVKSFSRLVIRFHAVIITLMVIAYVGPYLYLRSEGGYSLTQTGTLRSIAGTAIFDVIQWSPLNCRYQPDFVNVYGLRSGGGNKLGKFYAPLIRLDRRFFFPDQKVEF